ncbi:Riboflavin biosynthesis protein [Nymphaea thermarum]|nr:Riboflavin biosynthesis protein [Nymphaea thermarum]
MIVLVPSLFRVGTKIARGRVGIRRTKGPSLGVGRVRTDWENLKIDVMYKALKHKFSVYPHLNALLLSTAGSVLVEASPHDLFWGGGREGEVHSMHSISDARVH